MITPGKILWAACFLLISESCFARAGKESPQIGNAPPALILQQSVQGPPLQQLTWEKFNGQVVVMEFWNTSCGPCIQAIPHWNDLVDKFRDRPVIFLSITDDNPDALKNFLKIIPMKGWMAIDDPFGSTRTAFDVIAIPHTVLIDKNGKLAAITHPMSLKAEHLEELLAGKPTSIPTPKIEAHDEAVTLVSTSTRRLFEISISGPFPRPQGAFGMRGWDRRQGKFTAEKAYLSEALGSYFDFDSTFVISDPDLPQGLYDITVSGPAKQSAELQKQFVAAFQTAFGFNVKTNRREMTVYEMTLVQTNASNLRQVSKRGGGGGNPGGFHLGGVEMRGIANQFAEVLKMPVIDETHSTNIWQVKIGWEMTAAENLPLLIYRQVDRKLAGEVLDDSKDSPPDDKTLRTIREKIGATDFAVLEMELKKPAKQRFQPDPANIIAAAREQLGLQLTLTNRTVPVLEITKK